MSQEKLEANEKLEQIEVEALENTNEVAPLEENQETVECSETFGEPDMEMSTCPCTGGCGSNYSTGGCQCSGNCGSNYHKG